MTLQLLLEMAIAGHSERPALGRLRDALTFADAGDNAARLSTLIRNSAPDHLVFVGRNGPAYPQLLLGSALAGVPFAPLNYRLSSPQLRELIGRLDNPLIVADDDYLDSVSGVAPVESTTEFFRRAEAAEAGEPVPLADDATAVLLFTSGTTAQPKAVILRHQHLMSYVMSTVEFGAAEPEEAALVSVPPYHVAAVGSALTNLYAGRRVVYLPDFEPAGWLATASEERVTTAMIVPTMLARIVEVLEQGGAPAPAALRLMSYGGARMPQPVLERALRLFPNVGFVNAYGLTETSSTIALLGPDDHREALASEDPAVRARLSSIGRPVPGIEVSIRGEDDEPLPTGDAGELWVRGAQVSGEYRGLGSLLDKDGWFNTRDRARQDPEGFLFIEGRTDDTIIRGGENIAPAEIEDVLLLHPAVKSAAVVGRPDDEWGERIVAVVVPERGAVPEGGVLPEAQELRDFVRARLRGSRTPDEVVWREELPYTATGKLLRRTLLESLTTPIT